MSLTLPSSPAAEAFEALLEPCKRRLWTFLLRLVQDRALAEELYQETLLRAWRGLPAYEDDGRFLAWTFRIAHNVVRDERRRRAVRPTLVTGTELPEVADARRSDHRVEARERRRRVSRRLPLLTAAQREVLLLRMHSDLTFREIAELVEAPLSTVINRMRDALEKLDCEVEDDR